jgi:predicted DNA-binding transcriptional regulator
MFGGVYKSCFSLCITEVPFNNFKQTLKRQQLTENYVLIAWIGYVLFQTSKKKILSELETRGSKINVYKVEQIMGYNRFERAVIASFRNVKYPNDEY